MKKFLDKLSEYDEIVDIWGIGRRVFAKNGFDGILTIIGIIMGSYFSKVNNAGFVITTGIGACIAMGVSGIWGTYFTERAERKKNMHELEKLTLNKLDHTIIEKAQSFAAIIISLIDGLSPFLASLVVLIPFFIFKKSLNYAYLFSIILAFILLALLGAFLGKVSKGSVWKNSLNMVLAGLICIILSMALDYL